jgi:hypothetical protein
LRGGKRVSSRPTQSLPADHGLPRRGQVNAEAGVT